MPKKTLAVAYRQPLKPELQLSVLQALDIKLPIELSIERAVIGACLLDYHVFKLVQKHIHEADIFYEKSHQSIFRAFQRLDKKNAPIDLITIRDELKKMGLFGDKSEPPKHLKNRLLARFQESAVSKHLLMEISQGLADSLHAEYHALLLHEQYMRRNAINLGVRLIKEAAAKTSDIYDVIQTTQKELVTATPNKILGLETMVETMEKGAAEPPIRYLVGSLVKENEICFLFADTGVGKSILAFQIADNLSKGLSLFSNCSLPEFANACGTKSILFFDFELKRAEIYDRYSTKDKSSTHQFKPPFQRSFIYDDFIDYDKSERIIISAIEQRILEVKPDVIIVDNISYMISDSQDGSIAINFMKRLRNIQQKSEKPLTIIVVAHTPKRDNTLPLDKKDMAGSKSLSNFASTMIAIAKSSQDPYKRYIKHVKCRTGENLHDSENVIEVQLQQNGARLEFEYLSTSREVVHLTHYNTSEHEAEAVAKAYELHKGGVGFRTIAKKLKGLYGINWSYNTIRRRVKAFKAQPDTLFDEIDEQGDAELDKLAPDLKDKKSKKIQ